MKWRKTQNGGPGWGFRGTWPYSTVIICAVMLCWSYWSRDTWSACKKKQSFHKPWPEDIAQHCKRSQSQRGWKISLNVFVTRVSVSTTWLQHAKRQDGKNSFSESWDLVRKRKTSSTGRHKSYGMFGEARTHRPWRQRLCTYVEIKTKGRTWRLKNAQWRRRSCF